MQPELTAGPMERLVSSLYADSDFFIYPSRKYLLPHLPALRQFDVHQLLTYLFQWLDYRSGPWFLSRLPELWQTWGCDEWRHLFRLVSPRRQPTPMFLHGYADVQFWLMDLKLNPLPLLLSANLESVDLWYVTQQLRVHAPMYIKEPREANQACEKADHDETQAAELAEIDAENQWCEQRLQSIRQTLLKEDPDLLPPWEGVETFRDYVAGVGDRVRPTVEQFNPEVSQSLAEVGSLGNYVARRIKMREDNSSTKL